MHWIKRMLKKLFRNNTPTIKKIPNDFKPSLGFVVPHIKEASGAVSFDNKYNEYNYALEVLENFNCKYETRDDGGVYGANKRLVERGCNVSCEPHLNAYNTKAKGCEVLIIKGDTESRKYAEALIKIFKEAYPDRLLRASAGVKEVTSGQNGYNNLVQAKKAGMYIAILSELFFIDNREEWIDPKDMASILRKFNEKVYFIK